jgi:hypothetical protein
MCIICRGASVCIHEKQRNTCRMCKGSSFCSHDKIRSKCKICKGGSICSHDKEKSKCKECTPSAYCTHDRIKYTCRICNPTIICIHKRLTSKCKDCNSTLSCEHGKRKERCKICKGSAVCIHERDKYACKECNTSLIKPKYTRKKCEHNQYTFSCIECHPSLLCEHEKRKNKCKICMGSLVCIHAHDKYTCRICRGSAICSHDILKSECITCTPTIACLHCKHINASRSKWNPYCFRCYCVLNPDAVIPRKYKLKEHHVVDFLKSQFQETLTMRFDKMVEGGCSRKRPDVFIDFGSHCLIIEVDEHQHVSYSCEEKRMIYLYEDVGFRKIVFLRFNPDRYKDDKTVYLSPFRYTRAGILHLEETEFRRRMDHIVERIHVHRSEPTEQITVEYMFMDHKTPSVRFFHGIKTHVHQRRV